MCFEKVVLTLFYEAVSTVFIILVLLAAFRLSDHTGLLFPSSTE